MLGIVTRLKFSFILTIGVLASEPVNAIDLPSDCVFVTQVDPVEQQALAGKLQRVSLPRLIGTDYIGGEDSVWETYLDSIVTSSARHAPETYNLLTNKIDVINRKLEGLQTQIAGDIKEKIDAYKQNFFLLTRWLPWGEPARFRGDEIQPRKLSQEKILKDLESLQSLGIKDDIALAKEALALGPLVFDAYIGMKLAFESYDTVASYGFAQGLLGYNGNLKVAFQTADDQYIKFNESLETEDLTSSIVSLLLDGGFLTEANFDLTTSLYDEIVDLFVDAENAGVFAALLVKNRKSGSESDSWLDYFSTLTGVTHGEEETYYSSDDNEQEADDLEIDDDDEASPLVIGELYEEDATNVIHALILHGGAHEIVDADGTTRMERDGESIVRVANHLEMNAQGDISSTESYRLATALYLMGKIQDEVAIEQAKSLYDKLMNEPENEWINGGAEAAGLATLLVAAPSTTGLLERAQALSEFIEANTALSFSQAQQMAISILLKELAPTIGVKLSKSLFQLHIVDNLMNGFG